MTQQPEPAERRPAAEPRLNLRRFTFCSPLLALAHRGDRRSGSRLPSFSSSSRRPLALGHIRDPPATSPRPELQYKPTAEGSGPSAWPAHPVRHLAAVHPRHGIVQHHRLHRLREKISRPSGPSCAVSTRYPARSRTASSAPAARQLRHRHRARDGAGGSIEFASTNSVRSAIAYRQYSAEPAITTPVTIHRTFAIRGHACS